ncbi:MAG: hypothetical protein H6573_28475 [Lewinellaceae bacterium]|nr:hypothetical protein [Lewinellaceae bacterium]
MSDEFVDQVYHLLPPQPWPIGIHKEIIDKLNSTHAEVSSAISKLIETKKVLSQRDGVLYNPDGSVNSYDEKRVDPKTLKLLDEE